MEKIKIFVTLGPSSLNKLFLKYIDKKVSLVRLNMSHVDVSKLRNKIKFIKKNCSVPICIDTEGAQIRTKLNKITSKKIRINQRVIFNKTKGSFNFYPLEVFDLLKKGDLLDVGFEGLQLKLEYKTNNKIIFKCTNSGIIENNKGVHIRNRKIKLNFITEKDYQAISIAKSFKINNFALSFTNTPKDLQKFCSLLPKENKYFKIETLQGLQSLNYFFKKQKNFLIDRGDLSKDIGIENIPRAQRDIFKNSKKFKGVKIAVATNFLETMIKKPFPTRAEVNDIYNSLEMGASALVLAGETAMGKYPIECVKFLINLIKVFNKDKKKNG